MRRAMIAERRRLRTEPVRAPRSDVRGIDLATRRVALITDWGYVVADIGDGVLRLDDVIEGPVETLGLSALMNLSTGKPVTLKITHVQATRAAAGYLLQRPMTTEESLCPSRTTVSTAASGN